LVLFLFFFLDGFFSLFSQEAIACDTRQGTRRLFFRMDGFCLFCLIACSAKNTNMD
jgi:hypothetical protein